MAETTDEYSDIAYGTAILHGNPDRGQNQLRHLSRRKVYRALNVEPVMRNAIAPIASRAGFILLFQSSTERSEALQILSSGW